MILSKMKKQHVKIVFVIINLFLFGSINAQEAKEYTTTANVFKEIKLDENLKPTSKKDYSYIVYDRYDSKDKKVYKYTREFKRFQKIKEGVILVLSELTDSILLTGTIYTLKNINNEKGLIPSKNNKIEKTNSFDYLTKCKDKGFSYQVKVDGTNYCFYKGYKGWAYYQEKTNKTNKSKPKNDVEYPYFKHTPPLIGIVGSYNFIKNNQIELGLQVNLADINIKTGAMAGVSLSYLRPLDRNLNTVAFDLGVYSPVTLGMGINSNFDDKKNHILGYKLFVGTTFYHTSIIYEYNFLRNKKNNILQLNHHALKLRIVIPLFKLGK